ncbi:hypothetical protein [Methylobacterium mesophilicum]
MPSPTHAPTNAPALVASAEGELLEEALRAGLIAFFEEYEISSGSTIDREMTVDALLDEPLKPILSRLTAADTYPSGEPTTDLDHARYDRDGWMESALRAQGYVGELQGRLAAALARAERAEKALDEVEACMSIVEPRSDKAEYLRILGVVRAALAHPAPAEET